jgi:hypothetical protein
MECPNCHGNDCTEIEITLKGDENVKFTSCRYCESKWWEREGTAVDLNQVLTLTAERERR